MIDCFNVRNTKQKYKVIDLKGADLITLPAGRWCVSNGSAGTDGSDIGNWFVEVIEFDESYRTLSAYPYESNKKYFYIGKCIHGIWTGWEKYTPVL